eukprot:Nk52_evm64s212 gene=Nk52_evmTU64s212
MMALGSNNAEQVYEVDWKGLLKGLNDVIDDTPVKKDVNYKPIIFALDEILDELKSGEKMTGDVWLQLFTTLKRLYVYSNWHLKQSVTFAFPSLFVQAGKEALLKELKDGKNALQQTLMGLLCDEKREIRDASSQSLGALSRVLGNDIFQFVLPNILGAMDAGNAEMYVETWQGKEGFMIAIGYIVRNCKDISFENFSACVDILVQHCKHTKYGSYSVYIRRQAAKALGRIVDSSFGTAFLVRKNNENSKEGTEETYMEILDRVSLSMLNDEQIDVRKAAAELAFCIGKVRMVKNPSSLNSSIKKMMVTLGGCTSWEGRHGICLALSSYCRQEQMIGQLNSFEELFDSLSEQIYQKHLTAEQLSSNVDTTEHRMGVAATSNACAAQGLVDLFIAFSKLKTAESGEDADALAGRMQNSMAIFGQGDARKLSSSEKMVSVLFSKKVEPQLEYLLNSPEALLLDAGGTCLNKLLKNCPLYIDPYLGKLMCLVYKNMFHASLPIRDGAIKNWDFALRFLDEQKFLYEIAEDLIRVLLVHAKMNDNDVRETVFKAFEDLFKKSQVHKKVMFSKSTVENLLPALIGGTKDDRGGHNSEYPRAAAIRALAEFIMCSKDVLKEMNNAKSTFRDSLVPLACELLGVEGSESMLISSLLFATNLSACGCITLITEPSTKNEHYSYHPFEKLLTPLLVLTHSGSESVKYEAAKAFSSVFGNFDMLMEDHPECIHLFIKDIKNGGPFSLLSEYCEEADVRESVARVFKYLCGLETMHSAFLSKAAKAQIKTLFVTVLAGLIDSENLDSMWLKTSLIGFLCSFMKSRHAKNCLKEFSNGDEFQEIVKKTSRYLLYIMYKDAEAFEDYEDDDDVFEDMLEEGSVSREDLEEDYLTHSYMSELASVSTLYSHLCGVMEEGESAASKRLAGDFYKKFCSLLETEGEAYAIVYPIFRVMDELEMDTSSWECVENLNSVSVNSVTECENIFDCSHWSELDFKQKIETALGILEFANEQFNALKCVEEAYVSMEEGDSQNELSQKVLALVNDCDDLEEDVCETAVVFLKGLLMQCAAKLVGEINGESLANFIVILSKNVSIPDEEEIEEDDENFYLWLDCELQYTNGKLSEHLGYSTKESDCTFSGGYRTFNIVPLMNSSPLYLQNIAKLCAKELFKKISPSDSCSLSFASSLLIRLGMLKSEFKVMHMDDRAGVLIVLCSLVEMPECNDTVRLLLLPFFVKFCTIVYKNDSSIPSEYRWYPRVLFSLLSNAKDITVKDDWLKTLVSLGKQKWLKSKAGRAAVGVAAASYSMLKLVSNGVYKGHYLQFLSDIFIEEDIGEARWPLFSILQKMTLTFERNASDAKELGFNNPKECPLILPTPNPVMTAKDNATFDEHQSV